MMLLTATHQEKHMCIDRHHEGQPMAAVQFQSLYRRRADMPAKGSAAAYAGANDFNNS